MKEKAFSVSTSQLRGLRKPQKVLARKAGKTVLGTFHSHPISEAIPSPGDFMGAGSLSDSLMLIYDVCGIEARLGRDEVRHHSFVEERP